MDDGNREIIETSLGPLWITHCSNGYMRVWWPFQARAGELAMSVLDGKAQ